MLFYECIKILNFIDSFEKSDLVGREFTKKELAKICRGICGVDYVLNLGYNSAVGIRSKSNFKLNKFVSLSRVEEFEVSGKTSNAKHNIAYYKGKKIDINKKEYTYNALYKKLVDNIYPNLKWETVEKENPIIGKRYYYTLDLEYLKRCVRNNSSSMALQIANEMASYQSKLDKTSGAEKILKRIKTEY